MATHSNLPVINLELGARLLGNKEEAKWFLNIFLRSLPGTQITLDHLYETKNWKKFAYEIEKLLSEACYCSVPRLEAVTRELLVILGSDISQVNNYYPRLTHEMNELKKLADYDSEKSTIKNTIS